MPKWPSLKARELIAALEQTGFYRARQRGSHVQLKKGNLLVTVPVPSGDLHQTTLRSILRQARISLEELQNLL